MTEPLTGLDESPGMNDAVDEAMDLPTEARFYALPVVAAAYPIIAAAVRADERAKVLAEVRESLRPGRCPHCKRADLKRDSTLGCHRCRAAYKDTAVRALSEPTP